MTVPTTLLASDLDQAFGDWGVTVTFRQVAAMFDPETQRVAEIHTDTSLAAIVGPAPSAPMAGTAAPHLGEERQFLVRSDALPTGRPAPSDRIVHDGAEYSLMEFTQATGGLVYWLRGRRRA